MKQLIRELRKTNPNIEKSIFAAIHDVQIDTLAGCKFAGRRYAFTEYYDKLGQSSGGCQPEAVCRGNRETGKKKQDGFAKNY